MFELCISGHAFNIFLRSSLAHTMNAFIGRLICGLFSLSLFCCLTIFAKHTERGNISPPREEDRDAPP